MQRTNLRSLLLGVSIGAIAAAPAFAQASAPLEPEALADIVVTAQKREQSVQDVPIAVTALTGTALATNRVTTINDISGLAPGVTVRPSAGGVGVPSFTIRGAVSYGVVPGSDKQVSIYLDGVYISSPRGSIFDLPDVTRIEMLRGPQGTLFGRNATAGAMSVTTRDPTGQFGVKTKLTVGNYDQNRIQVGVDLPQVGPFSGYASFVHYYKRGEVRNLGAGQVWDRRNSPDGKLQTSPKWLGTRNSDSYFAALKFEPSDTFSTVYKFDYSKSKNTPEASAFVGYDPTFPLIGNLIGSLISSQPTPFPIASDGRRPDAVFNSWSTVVDQKVQGHSLTSNLRASDSLTFKNIAAYRKSSIFATAPIDGLAALTFTPQTVVPYATFAAFSSVPGLATASPAVQAATIGAFARGLASSVGQPFVILGSSSYGTSSQYSDELQANFESDFVTLTAGALWFHGKDRAGTQQGLGGTTTFAIVPNGVLPIASQGISYNKATSLAAYTQAEFHVLSTVDLVGGIRVTHDKKSGSFIYGLPTALTAIDFTYKKTKPSYLVGVNYKPSRDLLVYAKFSTAFVSGGKVGTIEFDPETVASYEGGIKADLFDRRIRTNLAVFHAKYKNVQSAASGSSFSPGTFPNQDVLTTFIIPQGGPVTAKGFEFEGTGLIAHGLTAGGSLGYTKTTFKDVAPVLLASGAGEFVPTLRPKWTGTVWGQFESRPIFDDARAIIRVDGNWRSKMALDPNQHRPASYLDAARVSPAHWIVNGRAGISDIKIAGAKVEVSVWARNMFDNKSSTYAIIPNGFLANVNFEPARTFGLDLGLSF
ncbi:TonB-dependent receptor [Sphingomonas sp. BIUV-7]|uniref:TonB-dependent receptor n=1 Tax=Sphingomonas natans TaxID=3063330 RepID=A0ABT8Y881_9SPHN|nr:TonB-dependent receptor [Sphingomonas sp. BIUV-7]MDO6414527.1 TonB-dependent receptor [Sphingomonas sp. BIUV-7]